MRAVFAGLVVVIALVRPSLAQAPQRAGAEDLSRAMERVASLVGPAVVEIFTTGYKPGEGPVGRVSDLITTERGSGSGVIVDSTGFIVTNAHVVRGALRLRVELPAPS